jgi:hypothetical protein
VLSVILPPSILLAQSAAGVNFVSMMAGIGSVERKCCSEVGNLEEGKQ